MWNLTGVIEPKLDVEVLRKKQGWYATLAEATSLAYASTVAAAAAVLRANTGPAADGFRSQAIGDGSIGDHVGQLAGAASRTANAYSAAAEAGGSGQLAMYGVASDGINAYWQAVFNGASLADLSLLIKVIRIKLQLLESSTAAAITTAFSTLQLPETFNDSSDIDDGQLAPGIEERWAELTDEERMAALQSMADEYADANGFPRIDITFESIEEEPGAVTWGNYTHGPPATLRLNSDELSNPMMMINTVFHEMQHRAQYSGMEKSRWPWQDEINGMSRGDAERWRELNADNVRSKGGDPGDDDDWDNYWPRPVETDARNAGRDGVNNMSLEEFESHLP